MKGEIIMTDPIIAPVCGEISIQSSTPLKPPSLGGLKSFTDELSKDTTPSVWLKPENHNFKSEGIHFIDKDGNVKGSVFRGTEESGEYSEVRAGDEKVCKAYDGNTEFLECVTDRLDGTILRQNPYGTSIQARPFYLY